MKVSYYFLILLLITSCGEAQQVSDDNFTLNNPDPAFAENKGPKVCIDEGHYNFHTADGRYKPFAKLLRGDGYQVIGFKQELSKRNLKDCDLLVIANPLAEANKNDWSYPHPSAFTKKELQEIIAWIRDGGRLLLFADHAPIAGATRDLGAVLGLVMIDAYAFGGAQPDQFSLADKTLIPHPIINGRSESEKINKVATFTGQAVQITEGWEPLLIFGPNAVARISLQQAFQNGPGSRWPSFSVAGWVHAAVRHWDKGRIVFFGEAAMCSAQLAGPNKMPMGMNHPAAEQNAQLCLNTVRWLTGVLDKE